MHLCHLLVAAPRGTSAVMVRHRCLSSAALLHSSRAFRPNHISFRPSLGNCTMFVYKKGKVIPQVRQYALNVATKANNGHCLNLDSFTVTYIISSEICFDNFFLNCNLSRFRRFLHALPFTVVQIVLFIFRTRRKLCQSYCSVERTQTLTRYWWNVTFK